MTLPLPQTKRKGHPDALRINSDKLKLILDFGATKKAEWKRTLEKACELTD